MKRARLLAFAAITLASTYAQAADVIITAERLLDVRSGRMVQRPEILVRDGKVVSIKPNAATAQPTSDVTRIDLPGMTVSRATGA